MAASTDTAKLFRKAAKLLADKAIHSDDAGGQVRFSCCAIAEAEGIFPEWNSCQKHSDQANRYRYVFDGEFSMYYSDEGREERILALCMMAAIVEAGDDKSI